MAKTPRRVTASARQRDRPSSRPLSRRQEAERQRERILTVAEEQFRQYGFDRTSLAEVGAAVGLTRGAVLYHFGSKAELLGTLLEPFMTGLDAALEDLEAASPPPSPRAVVDVVLDLLLTTRIAADLLARDIATRHALDLDTWFSTGSARLVRLMAPSSVTDPGAEARAYAALGALIRPMAHVDDPVTVEVRRAIRQAALAALGRPRASR
jgi:AcrR family transcriptional regulator